MNKAELIEAVASRLDGSKKAAADALEAFIDTVAAAVAKGDKVVLWGENRPEWIACYWGIQLVGAIAVPIDYRSSRDFAERIRAIV